MYISVSHQGISETSRGAAEQLEGSLRGANQEVRGPEDEDDRGDS